MNQLQLQVSTIANLPVSSPRTYSPTNRRCFAVLSCVTLAWLFGGIGLLQAGTADTFPMREAAPGVWQVGRIAVPALTESSGLITCNTDTNVFWTHNDGSRRTLYAVTRSGKPVAEFTIETPPLSDWEDIARDSQGHLYLADIGNNEARRSQLAVYQFDEPNPGRSGALVKVNRSWKLRFPGKPFDCESLFVWDEYGYLISKVFNDQAAEVYRFPLTEQKEAVAIKFVTRLPVTSPVTAATLSPDGQRLGLLCKAGAYIFQVAGEVRRAATAAPQRVKFREGQLEGCCFVPEGLLAVSEQREIFLFSNEAFGRPAK